MAEKLRTYEKADIANQLKSIPGWTYDGGAIVRTYKTSGWGVTLMAANAIGFVCEAAGHHPDLAVSWDSIGIRLWTHSEQGITDKDFETARLIESTVLWKPTEASVLKGPPKEIIRGSA